MQIWSKRSSNIVKKYKSNCPINVVYYEDEIKNEINNIYTYKGRYIIFTEMYRELIPDYCLLIFETSDSVIDEKYYLYYINY